jgi:hypothetical protein
VAKTLAASAALAVWAASADQSFHDLLNSTVNSKKKKKTTGLFFCWNSDF